MNRKISLKNVEWSILVCVILLIGIGCVALYSATQGTGYDELKKQLIWLVISIPITIAVIAIDYEIIIKFAPIAYGIMLALLVAVLFTKPINGATSWFVIGAFSLQPAEFAKIFVVLSLASAIAKVQEEDRQEISKLWKLRIMLVNSVNSCVINYKTTRLWYSNCLCCGNRTNAMGCRNK